MIIETNTLSWLGVIIFSPFAIALGDIIVGKLLFNKKHNKEKKQKC